MKPTTSAKVIDNKQRPNEKGQLSAKRALNETISPRGEHKKQRLDQTRNTAKTSYAQAASASLSVAITCAQTGSISRDISEQVLVGIQKRIFGDALTRNYTEPPKFQAKPIYTEGILKLWCANENTRTWLQRAISEMVLTANIKLVVKSQSDIPQRARCGILIPDPQGLLEDARNIGRVLSFQNPEVEVTKWTLLNATKQDAAWFVVVGIPEDQVPTLMKAGRRLAFGVGTVYVKFQNRSGKFTDVPLGWDASTATIKQELKQQPTIQLPEHPADTAGPSEERPTAILPTPANADQEDAPMECENDDILESISDLLGGEVESGELMAELKLGRDEEGTASDGVPFVES